MTQQPIPARPPVTLELNLILMGALIAIATLNLALLTDEGSAVVFGRTINITM